VMSQEGNQWPRSLQVSLCLLVFLVTSIGTAVFIIVAWKGSGFLIIGLVVFYFLVGIEFMPRKTPTREAFSFGIFVGIIFVFFTWQYNVGRGCRIDCLRPKWAIWRTSAEVVAPNPDPAAAIHNLVKRLPHPWR